MKYRIAIPNRDDLAGNELRAMSNIRKSRSHPQESKLKSKEKRTQQNVQCI